MCTCICVFFFFLVNVMHNKCNACIKVGTRKLPCLQLFKCNKSMWSYPHAFIQHITCTSTFHKAFICMHMRILYVVPMLTINVMHHVQKRSEQFKPCPYTHVCISCNISTHADGDMHIFFDCYLFNGVMLLPSLIYAYQSSLDIRLL